MSQNLASAFRLSEVSPADFIDFETIIGSHFDRSAHPPFRTVFLWPDDTPALELVYTKSGRVQQVIGHKGVTAALTDAIAQHLAVDLFDTPRWSVSRSVVFAGCPVTGFHRRGSDWQLISVPEDAPRPFQWLAPHPAFFEVRYRTAEDTWTNVARRARAETRALTSLNGLLTDKLRRQQAHGQAQWVTLLGSAEPSTLGHVSYAFTGMTASDEFSDPQGLPQITVIPTDDYYGPDGIYGRAVGEDFVLPNDIDDALDYFDALPSPQRGQFLRASYWATHARVVWTISQSASMVAAMSAVEALASPQELRLGQDGEVRDATKAFNEVVRCTLGEEYVKAHGLYDIRSALVHGSRLFMAEAEGWGRGPVSLQEGAATRFISTVLPVILHNWLYPGVWERVTGPSTLYPG